MNKMNRYALLELSLVANYVPRGITGNYLLANRDLVIFEGTPFRCIIDKYAGRSSDLRNRLMQHCSKGKYDYFIFEKAENKFDAVKKELNEWELRKAQLDNKIKPAQIQREGEYGE